MTTRVDVNSDGEIVRLSAGSGFVPLADHARHRLAARAYDLSDAEHGKIQDDLRRFYIQEQDGAPVVHKKTAVTLTADKERIEADGRDVVTVTASRGGVKVAVNKQHVVDLDDDRAVGLTTREAKLLVIEVDDPRYYSEPAEVLARMTVADAEQDGGVGDADD